MRKGGGEWVMGGYGLGRGRLLRVVGVLEVMRLEGKLVRWVVVVGGVRVVMGGCVGGMGRGGEEGCERGGGE